MKYGKTMLGLAAGMALAITQSAQANSISIGTGVDGNNYTVSGPGATGSTVAYYYGSPWVPNSLTGQWIAPSTANGVDQDPGLYTYSLTINASAGDTISGQFSSDNPGALFVNGTITSAQGPGWGTQNDDQSYEYWTPFTATLAAGVNTIQFEVDNLDNSPNPTGLIVQGTANVPDGGLTATLFGMGLLGLGAIRRKLS
jgi:hypothetical protein